jgi:bifunctional non-homologous end joining protein LigD
MATQRHKQAPQSPDQSRHSVGWQQSAARRLADYRRKRRFGRTPEPQGLPAGGETAPDEAAGSEAAAGDDEARQRIFVVQLHDATRLHYDFRLEVGGVLKSWAVPKGPSLDPRQKRLAMMVEDHPLEYAAFEGIIPQGQYGAGAVIVWDGGVYENLTHGRRRRRLDMLSGIEAGHVHVRLHGRKLKGDFALTRTSRDARGRESWLLVKIRDACVAADEPVDSQPRSILSGKTLGELV